MPNSMASFVIFISTLTYRKRKRLEVSLLEVLTDQKLVQHQPLLMSRNRSWLDPHPRPLQLFFCETWYSFHFHVFAIERAKEEGAQYPRLLKLNEKHHGIAKARSSSRSRLNTVTKWLLFYLNVWTKLM